MRYFLAILIFVVVGMLSILGFRGSKTDKPPIVVFPDMDFQPKYLAQGESAFFADGRVQRPVTPGTVARGHGGETAKVFAEDYENALLNNPELASGKSDEGGWVRGFPLEVTREVMQTGRAKFTIFCGVCHGATGDGKGVTKEYGMVATPTYHSDRLRRMAEGEIFNTITYGKGQMLGYADKLNPHERWAVIAYLRALQRSQNATLEDVPLQHRSELLSH